jgi:Uma2 family endonuclease
MVGLIVTADSPEGRYLGLRLSAEQFLQLSDDGCHYELIDGVVMMSPRHKPVHQRVAVRIAFELGRYLDEHPVGEILTEIDVHLGQGLSGGDLVYRPETIFLRTDRLSAMREKVIGASDLVVEVVSRGSRRLDSETKKDDYERYGVREYWLIDPEEERMAFWRLGGGRFSEISPSGDSLASHAVPGFVL